MKAISVLVAVSAIAGCAAVGQSASKQTSQFAIGANATVSNQGDSRWRDLAQTNDGLEIRRWSFAAKSISQLPNVLAAYEDGRIVSSQLDNQLKRNGFLFIRVPLTALDSIRGELGSTIIDANQWHGQVHDWRALEQRPIDSAGVAIAINGRVERFGRGSFELLLRSWSVMMEDGPRVQLELLPHHHPPQAQYLRRLLGEQPKRGRGFPSIAIDVQLESGFAYVLAGVSPSNTDLRGENVDRRIRKRIGPLEGIGPNAVPPKSFGEVILHSDTEIEQKIVLVFVPRISDALFPPGTGDIASK